MAGLKKIALLLAAVVLGSGVADAAASKKKRVRCLTEAASVPCAPEAASTARKGSGKASRDVGPNAKARGETIPSGKNFTSNSADRTMHGAQPAGSAPPATNPGSVPSSAIYHGSPPVTGGAKPTAKIIVPKVPTVVPTAKIKVP